MLRVYNIIYICLFRYSKHVCACEYVIFRKNHAHGRLATVVSDMELLRLCLAESLRMCPRVQDCELSNNTRFARFL
jgi:hypothetical protein